MNPTSQPHGVTRPRGEIFVWITGLGLTLGLLMIVFLLGLIVRNGLAVFWPKRVALVTFAEGSGFRGASQVAGVILEEQYKDVRDLTPEQLASPDPRDRREKKLFVGNRDAYGESFAYFMKQEIDSVSYPPELVMAERLEWGNAIFWPLRLEFADGTTLGADEPEFETTLRRLIAEVSERRQSINRIERGQIGQINLQMRSLELDERFFAAKAEPTPPEEATLERIRQQMSELRELYAPLAARAAELRQQQTEVRLHFRLPTGEERFLPIGGFVHFHYPNQLGLASRTMLFARQLWEFLTSYPREANTEGGIWPAIFGTVVMTLIMSVIVTPFGVLGAIYLREYARQGPLVRSVRIAINNLAGVPSIVFGIFGLGFFVYLVGGTIDQIFYPRALASNTPTFGTGGILWASLTLALMTVPVVIVATEESLAAVSRGVREGSLACGASKWQTMQRLVLPASLPGILTGLVLAMARGAGEVAPLILVGVVALAPNLPVDATFPFVHLERKFMHLGFHIYDLGFQSPDSEAAKPMVFATTLVLILLVIVLNLAAIIIRNRLRKRYASATF
jgi:phosphate transport system permease protein